MHRLARQGDPSYERVAPRRDWVGLDEGAILVGEAVTRGQVMDAALTAENECTFGRAQARRRLHERVEHGLQVEGRAADDLEHVGGRGLLLQRFTQVFRARLHLFEQPHVLDRDDSLVGEGLKQLDMMVGKRAGLCARDADLPDRHAIAHQGRKQHAAITAQTRYIANAGFKFGIDDLRGLALADQFKRRKFGKRPRE